MSIFTSYFTKLMDYSQTIPIFWKYFLPNFEFRNIFCQLGWQDLPFFPPLDLGIKAPSRSLKIWPRYRQNKIRCVFKNILMLMILCLVKENVLICKSIKINLQMEVYRICLLAECQSHLAQLWQRLFLSGWAGGWI